MALSVGIELVSSSARVTSVKSQQGVSLTDGQTSGHPDPKIGPQVYLGPIKITTAGPREGVKNVLRNPFVKGPPPFAEFILAQTSFWIRFFLDFSLQKQFADLGDSAWSI